MIYLAGKDNPIYKRRAAGWCRIAASLLLVLAILLGNRPLSAAAADWDSALEEIHNLYGDYTGLQETMKSDILRNQTLRKQNIAYLAAINSQLKSMNSALLSRLKSEAESMRKKHAPLLEQYTSLGKQASAARKAGNLKAATTLDLKRNKLKASANAARAEIKGKTTALAEARAATAVSVKPAKDALAPVPGLRKQITAQSKQISELQALRSGADKRYKAAVKTGDAVTAAAEMKLSYAKMGEIRSMLQQIYGGEQKISAVLRSAEPKIPK